MGEVIDQYMICTSGKGDFTDRGELKIEPTPFLDGCSPIKLLRGNASGNGDAMGLSNSSVTEEYLRVSLFFKLSIGNVHLGSA